LPPAIELQGITKTFGEKVAVNAIDLTIASGQVCGFLGPNGAGKTTTIRMVMSIIFPDRGRISVLGRPSALESKDRIGYLPEERGLYRKMRVAEFLRYMARLKGVDAVGLDARVKSWLERVGLADCERKRCQELSKGMQQKVQFISAIIHEPDLVILDEPFSGLDPVNALLLRQLFREQHQRGCTVIFSTHVMAHAEQLCDHIVMINRGRKVLDSSLQEIRGRYDPRTLLVEPTLNGTDPQSALTRLSGLDGVESAEWRDGVVALSLGERADTSRLMSEAAAAIPSRRLELARPSLEDIFIGIVRDSGGTDPDDAVTPEALRRSLRDPSGDAIPEVTRA
jgi:ABC-2 type transport system ATP-binding protein